MNNPSQRQVAAHDGELSILDIGSALVRNWKLFVLLPLTLGVVVGVWTLLRDHSYVASASFMPQGPSGGAAGGAMAFAQQFGVNLGGENAHQSPQFYVNLLQSRAILRRAVESTYRVPAEGEGFREATLIDLLGIEEGGVVPGWLQATRHLSGQITTSVNRETRMVDMRVTAFDAGLAEQVAVRLLELLNDVNTTVLQQRAEEEGRFIGTRVSEARTELLSAESVLQRFLLQNRDFSNSPELRFEHDRLQRQVMMRQEVYTSMLRAQEQAKIEAIRDTPLFAVIDDPIGSAVPRGRGITIRTMLAFFLGLLIATIIAFLREMFRRGRAVGDPSFQEFDTATRGAWHEIRDPRGWLRRTESASAPVKAGR